MISQEVMKQADELKSKLLTANAAVQKLVNEAVRTEITPRLINSPEYKHAHACYEAYWAHIDAHGIDYKHSI